MKRKRDLTGRRIGYLEVIREFEPIGSHRRWLCRCECGREKIIRECNLTSTRPTRSCGCKKGVMMWENRRKRYEVDGVHITHLQRNKQSNNRTGHKGVFRMKRDGNTYFVATLTVQGRHYQGARRLRLEDAVQDRLRLEELHFRPYIDKYGRSSVCKASDCLNLVPPRPTPGKPREYCSNQCRDREKARRYRKLRAKKGLCPQCGGPMDSPVSPHRKKISPQYCSRCQKYFRERHQKKKNR